jgi:putative membrane protein
MVRRVPQELKEAVDAALADAKKRTDAEIIVVVAPRSDQYMGHAGAAGLVLGSIAALALWLSHIITAFPVLLAVQAAGMAAAMFVPPFHALCVALIPRRIRHHRAVRRALQEFLLETHNVPAQRAAVMLYVSLAERHARIIHSRAVPAKVRGEEWDAVMKEFTAAMRGKAGLKAACTGAIAAITKILEAPFPVK